MFPKRVILFYQRKELVMPGFLGMSHRVSDEERKKRIEAGPIAGWETVYRDYLRLDLDLSGMDLPKPQQKGFDRLIVVGQGVTALSVYNACEKLFPCSPHWQLDCNAVYEEWRNGARLWWNDREWKESHTYVLWARDRAEADLENRATSVMTLSEKGYKTMNLVERLLYEIKYFWETGNHLDAKGTATLCGGSRYAANFNVPFVYWNPTEKKMEIGHCYQCGRGQPKRESAARSVIF